MYYQPSKARQPHATTMFLSFYVVNIRSFKRLLGKVSMNSFSFNVAKKKLLRQKKKLIHFSKKSLLVRILNDSLK